MDRSQRRHLRETKRLSRLRRHIENGDWLHPGHRVDSGESLLSVKGLYSKMKEGLKPYTEEYSSWSGKTFGEKFMRRQFAHLNLLMNGEYPIYFLRRDYAYYKVEKRKRVEAFEDKYIQKELEIHDG